MADTSKKREVYLKNRNHAKIVKVRDAYFAIIME